MRLIFLIANKGAWALPWVDVDVNGDKKAKVEDETEEHIWENNGNDGKKD